MRVLNGFLGCCGLVAALAVLNGCNKHNDDDRDYVVVQPAQPVMHEAAKAYPMVEDKAKGLKYAVLQHGAVITSNMDGWMAINPEFFTKLTGGIVVKTPEEDKMYHGVSNYMPLDIKTASEFPDRKATTISANSMVPKAINGWVAMDQDTFAKLIKDFMAK